MEGEKLLVSKIRDGTVIDHIPAGRALAVLRVLKPPSGARIAIVMNAESRRLGRKDIVKVEGVHLSEDETAVIALVAPHATINIVRGFRVIEKRRAKPPRRLRGVISCVNPTCITRKPGEPILPSFTLVKEDPPSFRCDYCGTIVEYEDIVRQLAGGEGPLP